MKDRRDIVPVGRVVKTHGIHGELSCEVDIEYDDFESFEFLFFELEGLYVPFGVSSCRPHGSYDALVKLDDVDSDTRAAAFVGLTVYGEMELVCEDDENPDGYYIDDMLGWSVWSDDRELGVFESYDDSTDNVLMNVRRPDGSLLLIPAAEEFFTDFSGHDRRIYMSLPQGLLDLN